MQEATAKVVEAGRRHGKPLGRPGGSPSQVQSFLEQGFLLQAPTDIGFLIAGAREYMGPFERAVQRAKSPSIHRGEARGAALADEATLEARPFDYGNEALLTGSGCEIIGGGLCEAAIGV